MKRFVALIPFLGLFFFSAFPAFSENSPGQIVVYHFTKGGIKEIRDHFKTDEKIYAEFTFLPEEKETGVEFRWMNPSNSRRQTDFELVKSAMPPKKRIVLFWMFLQSRLYHKFFGASLFGRWHVEIWVNGRRISEKAFDVEN